MVQHTWQRCFPIAEPAAYAPVDYPLPLLEDTTEISIFYVLWGAIGGGYISGKDSEEAIFWVRPQEKLNVNLIFNEPSEAALGFHVRRLHLFMAQHRFSLV